MYQSTYTSSEPCTKPAFNVGSCEYLKLFARRILATGGGTVEVRNAHGTLVYSAWTTDDGISEYEAA